MEKIVIVGYGGHAKVLSDSIKTAGKYKIAGYTDVEDKDANIEYLGTDECLSRIFEAGVNNAAIGIGFIGNSNIRISIYTLLKQIGFHLPAIIDRSAIISEGVTIGEGTYIGKRSVINPDSLIDKCCIINTGAIVEHECRVEPFSHISVGTVLCGNVIVGAESFVGANSTVIQGITIGNRCLVGAGSVVRKDLKDDERFV